MQQLELFSWSPPKVIPFPYYRRADVLNEIADAFVRDGFGVGNKLAFRYGAMFVADLIKAGVPHDEVSRELDKFIAAWRAVTIPRMAALQETGGQAACS